MSKDKKHDLPKEDMGSDEAVSEEHTPEESEAVEKPDPISTLEAELQAEKEKYLRLAAEYDNYRKRSQKERDLLYSDVRGDTIVQLLPVYDNLERALKQETEDEAFYKGVELTMAGLREILEKLGVSEIPTVGEQFDPELHNAVFHIEDDAHGENEIIEEFQKGFLLGDRVIRFSMVKVAN